MHLEVELWLGNLQNQGEKIASSSQNMSLEVVPHVKSKIFLAGSALFVKIIIDF